MFQWYPCKDKLFCSLLFTILLNRSTVFHCHAKTFLDRRRLWKDSHLVMPWCFAIVQYLYSYTQHLSLSSALGVLSKQGTTKLVSRDLWPFSGMSSSSTAFSANWSTTAFSSSRQWPDTGKVHRIIRQAVGREKSGFHRCILPIIFAGVVEFSSLSIQLFLCHSHRLAFRGPQNLTRI